MTHRSASLRQIDSVLADAAASSVSPDRRTELLQQIYTSLIKTTTSSEGNTVPPDHYVYSELSDELASQPKQYFQQLQVHWEQLWSHHLFSAIFALLYHQWICKHAASVIEQIQLAPDRPSGESMRLVTLIEGTNKLFWADTDEFKFRFRAIYEIVVASIAHRSSYPGRLFSNLRSLIYRFYPYYGFEGPQIDSARSLLYFMLHGAEDEPIQEAWENSDEAKAEVMIFVQECTRQLRGMQHESSLLRYITNLLELRDLTFTSSAANRLQAVLAKFTSPGGPVYPTRRLREASQAALDTLFPVRACKMGVGRR